MSPWIPGLGSLRVKRASWLRVKRSWIPALLVSSVLATSCSPGMFFGDGKDQSVLQSTTYRKRNEGCAGLDLSKPEMDVAGFKGLVRCLNSQGQLEELEQLVHRIEQDSNGEDELKSLVDVGNKYLLKNPKLMYELEQTYIALSKNGLLDDAFYSLGKLLQNQEFVAASLAILQDTTNPVLETPYERARRVLLHPGSQPPRKLNDDILRLMEKVSEIITPDHVAAAIDYGISFSKAQALYDLQSHFQQSVPSDTTPPEFIELVDRLVQYMNYSDPKHLQAGRELLNQMISGNLFTALDDFLGTGVDQFKISIPRAASVMDVTLQNHAKIMDDTTSLFHYMHRPLTCLKNSQTIPDGTMHVLREFARLKDSEISEYIRKKNLLTLMSLNPFCDYPQQLGQLYPSLENFAQYRAIVPAVNMMQSFFKIETPSPNGTYMVHPLAELLIGILADTGSPGMAVPENTTGTKILLPVLSKLNDLGVWKDLFLVTTLIRPDDRWKLQRDLSYLLESVPGAANKSIYDILTETMARGETVNIENLLFSLRHFVNLNDPLLADVQNKRLLVTALTQLRAAYYVNDVHPLIDLLHQLTRDAEANKDVIQTSVNIASYPEFQNAVGLLSRLAREHRLQKIVGGLVTMFHGFAKRGEFPVHSVAEPTLQNHTWHDLTSADLGGFNGAAPADGVVSDRCRNLDLNSPFYKEQQLDEFVACLNNEGYAPPVGGMYNDLAAAVSFLETNKTSSGQNFVEFNADLVQKMNLETSEAGFLVGAWEGAYDDGRFDRLLQAFPTLMTHRYHGDKDESGVSGPVAQPLMDVVRPIVDHAMGELKRLEGYAATVLRRPDVPTLIGYLQEIQDTVHPPQSEQNPLVCTGTAAEDPLSPLEPKPVSVNSHINVKRVMDWVEGKECENLPEGLGREQAKLARAEEIIDDYENSVSTWDLVDGRARRSYTNQELHERIDPILQKFTDTSQSLPGHTALDGMIGIVQDCSLQPGQPPNPRQHFTPDELMRFFKDRADDWGLMSYYYPGETTPRARLVSTLDRLETVLINADMEAPLVGNLGMKFLAELGDAWGDEDPKVWPPEIAAKFSSDPKSKNYPMTLKQAVDDMLSTLGFWEHLVGYPDTNPLCDRVPGVPKDPEMDTTGIPSNIFGIGILKNEEKSKIFNVRQSISVLRENLPGTGSGGLRILRDLFYQINYSTPAQFRNEKAGDRNNLSIIMKLVRLGMTRQIGQQVKRFADGDPALRDFFRSLVQGTMAPDIKAMLEALVVDDTKHELIWKVLDQLFTATDAASGHPSDPARQDQWTKADDTGKIALQVQWAKDLSRMKQAGFYALAVMPSLEDAADPSKPKTLMSGAVSNIAALLKNVDDRLYLVEHADQIQSALTSDAAALMSRAIYENQNVKAKGILADIGSDALSDPRRLLDGVEIVKQITRDPGASKSWDQFSGRMKVAVNSCAYRSLNLSKVMDDIADFMKESSSDPVSVQTAHKLRMYTADRLESGDFDELLVLAGRNPEKTYQVLQTLGTYLENGELKDYFALMRRSLSEPPL